MLATQSYTPTEEDRSYKGWKHLIPFRKRSKNPKTLPLTSAGPLSYVTGFWLSGLIFHSNKSNLTKTDLYNTPWRDSAACNLERFEKIWDEEVSKHGKANCSVVRAVCKLIRSRLIISAILIVLLSACAVVGPAYFLQTLLKLNADPDASTGIKILYIIALAIWTNFSTQVQLVTFTTTNVAAVRVRGGVFSAVFKKILYQKIQSKSAGELINLCAADGQRLYWAVMNGIFVFGSMMGAILGGTYSVYLLGPWGASGFVLVLVALPLPVILGRIIFSLRRHSIPITEQRVRFMSEILTAIRLVKMYAWEKSFAEKIKGIRKKEESVLRYAMMLKSILGCIPQWLIIFAAVFTIMLMTSSGTNVTYTQVFIFLPVLNSLRFSLSVLPLSMMFVAEGYHACLRVKELLTADGHSFKVLAVQDPQNIIEICNGYFGWAAEKEDETVKTKKAVKSRKSFKKSKYSSKNSTKEEEQLLNYEDEPESDDPVQLTLHNICLTVKEGSLLGICGSVGSGKTSIIQAMLGMMKKEVGTFAMNQSKKVAYVAQQAWIMNATAQENITFGQPFQQEWYDEVVEACALLSDFKQLSAGDKTEIGERGINLSGGQKQRISLARAVYSNSDLILLDDPLSAVDAHVGQHIFTHCIKGLLKEKTVVFVTHQLQFLTECDKILVLKDGCIAEEGTHAILMDISNGEYATLIKSFYSDQASGESELDTELSESKLEEEPTKKHDEAVFVDKESKEDVFKATDSGKNKLAIQSVAGKLTKKEDSGKDRVNMDTYMSYIQASGGIFVFLAVALLILICYSLQAFPNYWLAVWLGAGSGGVTVNATQTVNGSEVVVLEISTSILDNPRLGFYQLIYCSNLLAVVAFFLIKSQCYVRAAMRASSNMHDQLFKKLLASPMKFFDVTPCGQILNRFSSDLDEMDSMLPYQSEQLMNNGGIFLVTTAVIMSVFPLFIVVMVAAAAIFIVFYKIGQKGIQSLKRIENVTRSPLFSHISATVQGLDTIRAYKKEVNFHHQFNRLQDSNNMALFLYDSALRWTGGILDAMIIMVVACSCIFASFTSSNLVTPILAAMALTNTLIMTELFQFTVRLVIETEAKFSCVQRIQNYINNLESEPPAIIAERRPHKDWPRKGAIQFNNVDVRYREHLPLVLQNISLNIKSHEKIGIVGRTGSGKSSMTMALFRILELSGGNIIIDGIDISTIGLEDLRSRLSIIPQDPVLFVGTIRYNLDPFDKYSDEDLWYALSKCHVKDTIESLEGKLDANVVENGENFSVGERQLLCMARALLRNSKILVLDEATAAIDTETDVLIQETIRDSFADCTMLTIAHRLNTVATYDKILVLDKGQVVEFNTPQKLLANEHSLFAQMMAVQESQKNSAMESK